MPRVNIITSINLVFLSNYMKMLNRLSYLIFPLVMAEQSLAKYYKKS